jgi:hypothetical protein
MQSTADIHFRLLAVSNRVQQAEQIQLNHAEKIKFVLLANKIVIYISNSDLSSKKQLPLNMHSI